MFGATDLEYIYVFFDIFAMSDPVAFSASFMETEDQHWTQTSDLDSRYEELKGILVIDKQPSF